MIRTSHSSPFALQTLAFVSSSLRRGTKRAPMCGPLCLFSGKIGRRSDQPTVSSRMRFQQAPEPSSRGVNTRRNWRSERYVRRGVRMGHQSKCQKILGLFLRSRQAPRWGGEATRPRLCVRHPRRRASVAGAAVWRGVNLPFRCAGRCFPEGRSADPQDVQNDRRLTA